MPADSESSDFAIESGSETVLIVEDEAVVRNLAVRYLADHGYQVLQAADGPQALEVSRAHTG